MIFHPSPKPFIFQQHRNRVGGWQQGHVGTAEQCVSGLLERTAHTDELFWAEAQSGVISAQPSCGFFTSTKQLDVVKSEHCRNKRKPWVPHPSELSKGTSSDGSMARTPHTSGLAKKLCASSSSVSHSASRFGVEVCVVRQFSLTSVGARDHGGICTSFCANSKADLYPTFLRMHLS